MIGKTLGHYRVGEQLGRGGMGEVYLADDLNLNRKVALKFLPEAFATDPERMARFEREAKLLASLNHPNIAAIHGLEQAEGKRFIVMELVEGETLAQRLTKGSLPIEEALGICRQIAEGLEAAHEKGVIHRDLKPANVMITEGDKVKILDFGLAKALAGETQAIDASQSPTITEAMTQPGVILGTAAYMSPEQAKGKAVDKRADIWAFGCILYECLTGKRAFEGETVTETLASVLKNEPDWQKVQAKVQPLLHRCLEKDTKRRLRDIGDAMSLLEGLPESVSAGRPWLAWSIAAIFLVIAVALAFALFRQGKPAASVPVRLQINFPDKVLPGPLETFGLSPDGQHLAFDAVGSDGVQRLYLRSLDSLEARPLLGTEFNAGNLFFWSPDSRFVVFAVERKLKKIDISGGPAITICELTKDAVGGSWSTDGEIIFGSYGAGQGAMRVSAAGGTARPLTKLDYTRKERMHGWPTFLPDRRHFLFFCSSDIAENSGVYIGSLDNKPDENRSRQLIATNFTPVFVPSSDSGPSKLLFLKNQILYAQLFDCKSLEMIGEAIPLAEPVGSSANYGFFSASANGVLVYKRSSNQHFQLTWFDRQGKMLGTVGEPGNYRGVAISPNGAFAAVGWMNPAKASVSHDIYLIDLLRGKSTQLSFGKGDNVWPAWSPEGDRIIFISDRNGVQSIYQKLTNGAKQEELLVKTFAFQISWSSDGQYVLYGDASPKTGGDLYVVPLDGERRPLAIVKTEANEAEGYFSPDLRWIAYSSDESGKSEIYVRDFPKNIAGALSEAGAKYAVSKDGGTKPRWRQDGKELYYLALDGKVMAAEVAAGAAIQTFGVPQPLFQAPLVASDRYIIFGFGGWDVAADGKRFLLLTPATENPLPVPFNIVLNWTALLKK